MAAASTTIYLSRVYAVVYARKRKLSSAMVWCFFFSHPLQCTVQMTAAGLETIYQFVIRECCWDQWANCALADSWWRLVLLLGPASGARALRTSAEAAKKCPHRAEALEPLKNLWGGRAAGCERAHSRRPDAL